MGKKQHTCRFTPEMKEALEKLAQLRDRSVNYLVNTFVRQGINASRQEWQDTQDVDSISKGELTTKEEWERSGAAQTYGD